MYNDYIAMTLTQAAQFTKKFIFLSSAILVVSVTIFLGVTFWRISNPPAQVVIEELPNADFGNLPLPKFPDSKASSANFSYSIDTVDGNLPTFDKLLKVFIMPPTYASLLSGEKSQKLAEKLNLVPIPKILSDSDYSYTNTDSTMLINLDNGNFFYDKIATPSGLISGIESPDEQITQFKDTLNQLGQLKNEIKTGTGKVIFLKNNEGIFEQVDTIQEANALQISVWPDDVDGKRIYTPSSNVSLINAIVTGSADDINNYVSLRYTFWPVDTETFATYPSKTAYEALDDLKSGKGVVLQEPANPRVSILNVYLGYYEGDEYSQYLQPIYVFEGPGFLAYVPAINNQYYEVISTDSSGMSTQ